MFIRKDDVSGILSVCFGPDADPEGKAACDLTDMLRAWIPNQIPLGELDEALQDTLLHRLRRVLGAQMLIRDGSRWRRVRTADLSDASDRLIGLLFVALPENGISYELVREWAFRNGSISAMECLTKRFSDLQTPMEQAAIAKVLSYRLAERDEMNDEAMT